MSEPERIGIPTGAPSPRTHRCSGAALVVSRAEYRELDKHGQPWATSVDALPAEGKGTARTFCAQEEASTFNERSGVTYYYGLCASCSRLEGDQRRHLAKKAAGQ